MSVHQFVANCGSMLAHGSAVGKHTVTEGHHAHISFEYCLWPVTGEKKVE